MDELISVIVPVYNVEKYVEQCLQSIIAQTYKNIEIVVIDDGSTDSSGEICDRLAKEDSRIAVYHKSNGGVSAARNDGVEKSSGDYIAFVDSDDIIAPTYLEYLYRLLTDNDADISCCGLKQIGDHDLSSLGQCENAVTVCSGKEACKTMLSGVIGKDLQLSSAGVKLYKRRIVEQYKYPQGRKFEDTATTCKYLYACKTVAISNAALYGYFQNPNGIIQTNIKNQFAPQNDRIWASKKRAEFFEANGEQELVQLAWKKTLNIMYAISILNNGQYDSEIKQLLKEKSSKGFIDKLSLLRYSIYCISPKAYRKTRSVIQKLV